FLPRVVDEAESAGAGQDDQAVGTVGARQSPGTRRRAGPVRAEEADRRVRIERIVVDAGPGNRLARGGGRDPATDEDAGHQVDVGLKGAKSRCVGKLDADAKVRLASRR